MKKLFCLVIVLALIIPFVFASGKSQAPGAANSAALTPEQKWAKDNGLDLDESMEDLHKQALAEGGKVVIYTISSRHARIKTMFEADFPGMTLTAHNISSGELLEKFQREYDAGIRAADIIHSKEQIGEYYIDFVKKGALHNYSPKSIFANTNPEYMFMTPFFFELNLWFYNTEKFKESPLTSWWQLTTPEWRGKSITLDGASNTAYTAMLTTMIQHADDMAKDYRNFFGKDIVLAPDEPTAGHAWIKRYLANSPIIAANSNEVISMLGTRGQANPPWVGFASSVRLRDKVDQNMAIDYAPYILKPTNGIYAMNFLAIVNGAANPAGAKLYIRYLLGGDDGKGRGFSVFTDIGTWPARPEQPSAEGNLELPKIPLWPTDLDYVYNNVLDARDYWIMHR
jgi:iron(III) transport system substrate-binding protein